MNDKNYEREKGNRSSVPKPSTKPRPSYVPVGSIRPNGEENMDVMTKKGWESFTAERVPKTRLTGNLWGDRTETELLDTPAEEPETGLMFCLASALGVILGIFVIWKFLL